tara:strand:+ start:8037 stop:9086 length:1050 start_codon:yes stop_codon:yes gene_type:complete
MSPEEIKDSLQRLGYKLSDRGSYWQTSAVFRNGDNPTALQIYKNSGVWKDYVQDTSFNSFKNLVKVTLGTSDPEEIKKYISSDNAFKYDGSVSKNVEKITMEEIYPESMLDRLLPHYKFYNNKGINSEILKSLRGGLATSGKLNQRFVFPIFNENKQIHGFSGRDIYPSDKSNRPKWKHIGRKSNWVYPAFSDEITEKSISEQGFVIIVESIGDLLNLKTNGFDNVLVSFGLECSNKLLNYLTSLNPDKIILSLNNDIGSKENRGLIAAHKAFLKMVSHMFMPDKIKICLPLKNDFGDMGVEEFYTWHEDLNNSLEENQIPRIKSYCKNLERNGKISKNLSKNLKSLNE